jgi:hypothetical protein
MTLKTCLQRHHIKSRYSKDRNTMAKRKKHEKKTVVDKTLRKYWAMRTSQKCGG